MSNLLDSLNEEQRQAAACIEGPVMIIAGAGSGKTRTLTYRIANILQHGVDPFNVLALTFTNKAAKEMKERISTLIGNDARSVWMGTFHSIFARILRSESECLGYPSNFTIYDTDDSKSLIRNIVKEQNLDPKVYAAGHVLSRISGAKSNLIGPGEYLANTEIQAADFQARKPMIGQIYMMYNERLRRAASMDFDDLLFNTNVLFRDFPEVLYKYQRRFKYILVDEYQDTNYAQYLIVKKLAANNENICVVGDDAQSIYSFRGANIQNILNIKSDYPSLKTFKLEQNYRSTQMIVNAANGVISNNKDQFTKEIWTDNALGEKIGLIKANSDNEEGLKVAHQVFEYKMNNQAQNKDFAVLYRTNNQSRAIEDALRKLNIPYRIYGGTGFYKRKEIKDMLSYFRLVVNPRDEEALLRVINYPARGIGQTTLDRIRLIADHQQVPMWDVIENIQAAGSEINGPTKARIEQFALMIRGLNVQLKTTDAFELAKQIWLSCGIMKALKEEETAEAMAREQNIEELINAIKDFSETEQSFYDNETGELQEIKAMRTLDEFIQDIALLTDADEDDPENQDKVSLMTIHAAKGLEFPYVFVVGMEENLFPSTMCINTRAELEEERRLFYVAITRAEKKLFLSYAENRFRWGQHVFCEPSRFLEEIADPFYDKPLPKAFMGAEPESDYQQRIFKPKTTVDTSKFKKLSQLEKKQPLGRVQDFEPLQSSTGQTSGQTRGFAPTNSKSEISNIATSEITELIVGMRVLHKTFGQGVVVELEGEGVNQKVSVDFVGVGPKKLLTKFAKLSAIV